MIHGQCIVFVMTWFLVRRMAVPSLEASVVRMMSVVEAALSQSESGINGACCVCFHKIG